MTMATRRTLAIVALGWELVLIDRATALRVSFAPSHAFAAHRISPTHVQNTNATEPQRIAIVHGS